MVNMVQIAETAEKREDPIDRNNQGALFYRPVETQGLSNHLRGKQPVYSYEWTRSIFFYDSGDFAGFVYRSLVPRLGETSFPGIRLKNLEKKALSGLQ